MSIIIKGMDMPRSCGECGEVWCEHWHYSWNQPYESYKNPNCPLIEIPAPHGRLIDIDEVPKYNIVSRPFREGWNEALKYIDKFVPTILEAEE